MQTDRHEAMRRIIDKSFVRGESLQEEESLREHLRDCVECREYLSACSRTVTSLTGFSFEIDPGLNARVFASLAERAQQLEAKRPDRGRMLASFLIALALTVAGAFAASRFSSPVAAVFHMRPAEVQLGWLAFWVLPSLCLSLLFPVLPLLSEGWTNRKGRTL